MAAIADHKPAREIEVSLRIGLATDRAPRVSDSSRPVLHGSASEIAEQLDAYATAGVDHLIVDPEATDEQTFIQDLETFAEVTGAAARRAG